MDYVIPQVDGLDDTLDSDVSQSSAIKDITTTEVLRRVANFELNQAKQTAGIYRDAQIQDFKIVHKDNDKNINIECSSGFYVQVAKPTLCSLSQDYIQPVLGLSISCDNITKNVDALGHEVNLTLFFKITLSNDNTAKVTIHAHNSTRLVQVQGSITMPDRTTSALWFVKNVLNGKFCSLAKAKSFNIAHFNNAVTSMTGPAGNQENKKCGLCDVLFDSRSKPVYCPQCVKWFHKTSCHKGHRCTSRTSYNPGPPPTVVTSLSVLHPVPPSVSISVSDHPITAYASGSLPSLVTPNTIIPVTTPFSCSSMTSTTSTISIITVPCPSTCASYALPSSSSTISSSQTQPTISLNPDANNFHPSPPTTNQPRRSRNNPNISNFTPEKAEIESLKIELGYARTKITDLQTKIADKDQTINIYSQKIKLLEMSRTNHFHDKYFPTSSSNSSPSPASGPDVSLSLDCSCKIRAEITRNSARLRDFDTRFLSVVENIENKLANIYSNPSSSPLTTPASCPSAPPSTPSLHRAPATSFPQSPVNLSQPIISQSPPKDAGAHIPVEAQDIDMETSPLDESDFDFSESFSAPNSSPKVNLN